MKKITRILLGIGMVALMGCSDDHGLISFPVDTEKYYQDEIFADRYKNVYGSWSLRAVSGGVTGETFSPDFEYLQIQKIGIFKVFRNDSILAYGQIKIEEKKDNSVRIAFMPDQAAKDVSIFESGKIIDLRNDTLNLFSPCCDRFNYHFVRHD